ncbi:DUF7344 domain-containing protein [Natrarchaeobius chitinivorans]|uniref:ArsR family transcriptional regulator n=1 Tax=Natrarchaeobius chitinivorans TaxID=1679083 RepID=A0A3N6M3J6_NATCH|nr:ArsR family transcriptional regulator [Natrarchaeobius chitinivorans]RQG98048.1 ArsR family transcriptional regulator [Natrarchaeobius chitinivorans]
MSSDVHPVGSGDRGPLDDVPPDRYEILRHPRRLRLLEILDEHRSLAVDELTTEVIERESLDGPTGKTRQQVRITLVHNHLPRLAEYDIVERTDDEVELVDESLVRPDWLATVLGEYDRESLDHLVEPTRLSILRELDDGDRPISLKQLASALVRNGTTPLDDNTEAKISLHHRHLPALDDIGVVDYDHRSELVTLSEESPLLE